jgi:hypothetical protein
MFLLPANQVMSNSPLFCTRSRTEWYRIIRMALERLGLRDLSLASPTAKVLSHNRLVDSCGHPYASNTTLNHTPCCALRNNAVYADYPANAATFGITLLMPNSGPLIGASLTCSFAK